MIDIHNTGQMICNGPLTRYVKLRVAHAPGMLETFSPPHRLQRKPLVSDPACTTARASRTCPDACRGPLNRGGGETFPAFPAHAQPAILHIWQDPHSSAVQLKRNIKSDGQRPLNNEIEYLRKLSGVMTMKIHSREQKLPGSNSSLQQVIRFCREWYVIPANNIFTHFHKSLFAI